MDKISFGPILWLIILLIRLLIKNSASDEESDEDDDEEYQDDSEEEEFSHAEKPKTHVRDLFAKCQTIEEKLKRDFVVSLC